MGKPQPPVWRQELIRKKIAEILWREGGILREESGLSSALEALKRIKQEDLPRAKTESPKEILEKMEVENALLVGEMIVKSALMREESRGAHFRKDFPHTNDQKWKGNIFLRKERRTCNWSFGPSVKKFLETYLLRVNMKGI